MADKNMLISVLLKLKDSMTEPLNKVGRAMDKTADSFNKFGSKLRDIGGKVTAGLSLPIAGLGIAATRSSMQFNAAMAAVAGLIPGNIKRVSELKKGVQDMSIALGQSTDSLSGGLFQTISAFGDSAETLKLLEINAKTAKAGLTDVATATDLTSAVTMAYGDTTAAAVERVASLAFTANKLGKTTIPELGAAIGKVTAQSSALKISQEELFTVFATFSGVTGNTAEVSTQLKAVLTSMLKPSKELTAVTKRLGFESSSQMVKTIGLAESMRRLNAFVKGDEQALGALYGSSEAVTLALSMAGAQSDVFTKKLEAMKNSSGALEEAFKENTEGINKSGFQWLQIMQQLNIILQQLGDAILPVLNQLLKTILPIVQALVDGFNGLSDGTKQNIIIFGAFLALLGPVLVMVGSIAAGIGGLITAATALGVTLASLFAILALLPLALGTVYAVGKIFGMGLKDWAEYLGDFVFGLQYLWDLLANGKIITLLKELYGGFKGIIESAADYYTGTSSEPSGGEAMARQQAVNVSSSNNLNVNMRVRGEGARALVDNVSSSGDGGLNTNVISESYLGAM